MPGWAWLVIVVAVVVIVVIAAWQALAARRTRGLKEQFGPEYDRTAKSAGSRRKAEAELAARQERRDRLSIRPLGAETRARYARQWEAAQAQFVDSPQGAIATADGLVSALMTERGYPMDDFDQRAADVSVDHPEVVDNYRRAHSISERATRGEASTEDLRQALQHYRSLFEELLDDDAADQRLARDDSTYEAAETERTVRS